MVRVRMPALAAAIASILLLSNEAAPAEPVSFKGKTITMAIGDAPGGGTDLTGRLVASFLTKYLPGRPLVVARDIPGAGGISAMNYFVTETRPDGLSVMMGSTSQVDPKTYRKTTSQYDPAKFFYVGGVVRGGYGLIARVDAAKRLKDKAAKPVVMGSATGIPRNAMQMTMWGIEFLGWNARWVTGYRATTDLMLALDRGEIDMTTTGDISDIRRLLAGGKFTIIAQTGNAVGDDVVARPEFGQTPVFKDLMAGKLTDPVVDKAFQYWLSINAVDKFLCLPPGTPPEVVGAYRQAFDRMAADPGFIAQGKVFSDDFVAVPAKDVAARVQILASTPPAAMQYISALLRKQGLSVE